MGCDTEYCNYLHGSKCKNTVGEIRKKKLEKLMKWNQYAQSLMFVNPIKEIHAFMGMLMNFTVSAEMEDALDMKIFHAAIQQHW